jgi:hypothetical protein
MAVLSDYTDGTITVTNGSVDFTGTDTLWRSAAFREGDTVLLQGFTGVIAGTSDDDPLILSNTTGQFTEPWPGASGTFNYRMRYQPDNARFSAKSTALINLLANGILRGIADIGVEDGKLLIGNVAGLYDLIDKSELGTPDPNGNLAELSALTLAARQILQTDAAGALKAVALAANKLLNTDANGDLLLSDITAYGRSIAATANAAALRTVTGSDRPTFAAYPPADISIGNGINAVNMTATHVNVGNHWNGSRFLCPEAGNYLFSFSAQWNVGQDNTGYAILRIKRNGTTVIGGVENKGLYFKHVTITSVIPLAVGDTVTFEFELANAAGSPVLQGSNTRAHGLLVR